MWLYSRVAVNNTYKNGAWEMSLVKEDEIHT